MIGFSSILMFKNVTTRLNSQSRQIRKFCRGTLWLNSDAQLKNSLVFTFNRFCF